MPTEHRTLSNRRPDGQGSGEGGGMSMSTMKSTTAKEGEEMENQIRNTVYLEKWNDSSSSEDYLSSLSLRDSIIQLSSSSISSSFATLISTDIVQDCYKLLLNQVERLVDIAIAVQRQYHDMKSSKMKKKKGGEEDISRIWQGVLAFVSPLMTDHLHHVLVTSSDNGDDKTRRTQLNITLRRLLECCSEAIISASWMSEPVTTTSTSNKNDNVLFDVNLLPTLISMANTCLLACHKERSADEKRIMETKKKETSVLSSQDKYSESEKKELVQFHCALAVSKCRMELDNAINNEKSMMDAALTTAARKATIAATVTTTNSTIKSSTDLKSSSQSTSFTSLNAKFGTPYVQFLSAWSGMYHSPWPFCTVGQARDIVRNARETSSVASKAWGRDSSSIIEQLMLDIGEADLEGCLMGGFRNVSEKLYRRVIAILEKKEEHVTPHVCSMLKVHCLLGLARLSLSSDVCDAAAAEALARDALKILSLVEKDDFVESVTTPAVLCIYAWSVHSLKQLSYSYHVCASRQLVADACIRSSRPDDARILLIQAVEGKYFYSSCIMLHPFYLLYTDAFTLSLFRLARKFRSSICFGLISSPHYASWQ